MKATNLTVFCRKTVLLGISLFTLGAFAVTTSTIKCGEYVFDASPRAVLMTFVDGPTTRGFAWETDMTVSESKLWLLEGEHDAGDAALFLSDGRLVEGTCVARPEEPINVNCHKVKVYDLEPGKTYSYRLGGGDEFVYGTFAVPVVARSATFLNVNDAQVRAEDRLYVWENTMQRAATLVPKPDVILSGGDVIDVNYFFKVEANGKGNDNFYVHPGYDNVSFGDTSSWFHFNYWRWGVDVDSAVPYFPGIPWSLASGNQDCEGVVRKGEGSYGAANGDIFYQQLTAVNWASDTLCCHSYDYANVHVVILPCLGRGDATGDYSTVADWAEQDLARAKAASKTEWTVVVMHFGPYTTGDHGLNAGKEGGIAQLFAPIFSKYHVDLVMQAHDHTFSKTLPYKWDAAGVYTSAEPDPAVVNVAPATEVVDGETYDVNPKGTYYVCAGCAGHRVGEDGMTYAGTEGDKSYTTRAYKIATGAIAVDSAWAKKGDNASQNPAASMFGVLRIEGNVLKYDFYAVSTDGESEPVLYDTLRVKKAANFQVTPYVQHPAKDAMSVLWFTDQPGVATIKWWPAAGDPASAQTIDTVGTWAQALTNNLSQTGGNADVGTGDKFKHNARLTGLATGTRYTYAVELDGGVAYTNTFRTSPAEDSPIRFIYYNDPETLPAYRDKKTTDWIDPKTGAGRTYYATKNQGYASNIVEMVKREPDLYVIAGDLAYQGGRQENWDSFWQHNAGGNGLGWNDPAGSTPILAAIGNHDLQDAVPKPAGMGENCENVLAGETALDRYLTYFEVEPNGVDFSHVDGRDRSQMFHRVDYGPVSLIFIDSNNGDDDDPQKDTNIYLYRDPTKPFPSKWGLGSGRSPDFNPGSEQYNWLTNNLADARRKSKFTFVVCHHCPYSVGYHCRTNVTESGEWLSSRALRCLDDVMLKYGVDGWLCGHDEMMEHSRLTGTEVLDDGTTREHSVEIYDMGTAGDGLRGGQITKEPNPIEVYRAHEDAPEVWKDGVLVDGGKHYGHMEINVAETEPGVWTAKLEPVYIFVNQDANGNAATFERRVYDDVKVLTNDLRVTPSVPWTGEGTETDPYQVKDYAGLLALADADNLAKYGSCHFRQTADIDFAGKGVWDGVGGTKYNATAFKGVYDGAGFAIRNLTLAAAKYRGFFDSVNGAAISNLTVNVAGFDAGTADEYGFAAIAGTAENSVFENCKATGTIGTSDKPALHSCGGIVVGVKNCTFTDCVNEAAIFAASDNTKVGGIVGLVEDGKTGAFYNCSNSGALKADANAAIDGAYVEGIGGILGYNNGTTTIADCTNTGDVTALAANKSGNPNCGELVGTSSARSTNASGANVGTTKNPAVGVHQGDLAAVSYALVDGTTASYTGTLEKDKTYLLTLTGLTPAFVLAAAGDSISFDTNLCAAAGFKVTADATKFDVTETAADGIVTFTAALVPPPAEIDMLAFEHCKTLTVSGYAGSSALAEFPILVRLSTGSPEGFNPADAGANGAELRFFAADGTLIPHEIDEWNPAGESLVWVRVPALTAGTRVNMCWSLKEGRTVDALPAKDVWSQYCAVWHMNEGDADPMIDRTGNGHDLTSSLPGAVAAGISADYAVGQARVCTNAFVGGKFSELKSAFTLSGTVRSITTWASGYPCLFTTKPAWNSTDQGIYCSIQANPTSFGATPPGGAVYTTSISSVCTTPLHFALAYSTPVTSARFYNSGTYKASFMNSTITAHTADVKAFGFAEATKSAVDEFRVRAEKSSDDWVKAEYDTAHADAFVTWTEAADIIVLCPTEVKWSGSPIAPRPTLVCDRSGQALRENVDYTFSWDGVLDGVGSGTMTVTGINDYAGQINETFPIVVKSAYGGSTLFVSPTGSDSADCLRWATAGTISNACGRATAGTADERTTIVLKSGTAENPAVYDLSAVKLPAFGAYAKIPNAYVTVRSENLDRAGCVIRGGPEQDFRLFYVTGANVRFEGLTVEGHCCIGATATGNYSTANGYGGVLWGTANTVVTNCSFVANTSGGSSLNSGRYSDCTFISNTNTVSTGWRYGGLMSGDLQLAGCLFVSNVATAGYCVFGRCGTVTVTNCTFRHHFKGSGVVGYSSSDGGSCRFDDCTFVSNSVTSMASGGRIVDTCRFIDNSATCAAAGTCTNCTFSGSTSYVANGGTLRCSTVTGCNALILFWHAYVYNSTICSNTVTQAMCARMYRFEDNLVVHNTFTGTLAGDAYYSETVQNGGPTFWRDTIVSNDFAGRAVSANYFFYNCLLAHNTVTAETGVRSLIDTGYFFNCTVADNTLVSTAAGTSAVSGGSLRNCVVYGNSPCDLKGTSGTLTNVLYKTVYDAASLEARGTTFKVHPRFQTADAAHPYGYAPRFGAPQTKLGDATVLILANKAPDSAHFNIATNVWPEASVDLACEPRFNGETPDLGCYECWYPQAGFLLFLQ